jgi:hypothetical protein
MTAAITDGSHWTQRPACFAPNNRHTFPTCDIFVAHNRLVVDYLHGLALNKTVSTGAEEFADLTACVGIRHGIAASGFRSQTSIAASLVTSITLHMSLHC